MRIGQPRRPSAQPGPPGRDNALERLRLLGDDDAAIAAFLDEIDIRSPRDRELLRELARTKPLDDPDSFDADHRRAVAAVESLRRHGFQGSRAAASLGPLKVVPRWGIQLVARYIVVSHVRSIALGLRNLYWLREIEAAQGSNEMRLLRAARLDAEALVQITSTSSLGVPTFVIGGLVIPIAATLYRIATGVALRHWQNAALIGVAGVAIGLGVSWVVLRGTAMAARRIRLSVTEPLQHLWTSIGHCGNPPKDQSREFAIVAITLTIAAWVILPALVALALTA